MDRITTALLAEFSRENQIEGLPEERQFEHFAAYLSVSKHLSETVDTSELSTGSGGDTGIDAIAVIANGTLVTDPDAVAELEETNGYLDVTFIFVQAERSPSFEAAKIGTFGFGVQDFFKEVPTLPRNEAITNAAAIAKAIFDRSPKFTRGNPVCRLYYVTTGKWVEDANLVAGKMLQVRIFGIPGCSVRWNSLISMRMQFSGFTTKPRTQYPVISRSQRAW